MRSVPTDQPSRSRDLDEVRKLLFPSLPAEEGWARIDAALAGAADEARIERIEELAGRDLSGDLLDALKRLRRDAAR